MHRGIDEIPPTPTIWLSRLNKRLNNFGEIEASYCTPRDCGDHSAEEIGKSSFMLSSREIHVFAWISCAHGETTTMTVNRRRSW
ncbi:hypothetical protein L484_001884 [Morus notabilis]|uniref:Uncharacterized protein n=1 Tax=Morus notabilis TaxID=981085 RepID=W9RJX3_9ROSA|nr:hypothetical protein L484_001884 [Morus notabilis]